MAQALHNVLVFNNSHISSFQKWSQGRWYSQWTEAQEGESTCTLYVCVVVPANKIKNIKGRSFEWQQVLDRVQEVLTLAPQEDVHDISKEGVFWQAMAGHPLAPSSTLATQILALQEEETLSS